MDRREIGAVAVDVFEVVAVVLGVLPTTGRRNGVVTVLPETPVGLRRVIERAMEPDLVGSRVGGIYVVCGGGAGGRTAPVPVSRAQ